MNKKILVVGLGGVAALYLFYAQRSQVTNPGAAVASGGNATPVGTDMVRAANQNASPGTAGYAIPYDQMGQVIYGDNGPRPTDYVNAGNTSDVPAAPLSAFHVSGTGGIKYVPDPTRPGYVIGPNGMSVPGFMTDPYYTGLGKFTDGMRSKAYEKSWQSQSYADRLAYFNSLNDDRDRADFLSHAHNTDIRDAFAAKFGGYGSNAWKNWINRATFADYSVQTPAAYSI